MVQARDGALRVCGARIEEGESGATIVTRGPLPGVQAIGGDAELSVKLDRPIGAQAAISLWIRPPKYYRNGAGRKKVRHVLAEVPGMGAVAFVEGSDSCELGWQWDVTNVKNVEFMSSLIPELPGPDWYHLLYTWDSERGLLGGYVNGVPQIMPGSKSPPWEMPPRSEIVLRPGEFELADLKVEYEHLSPATTRARVPPKFRCRQAWLLGEAGYRPPMRIEDRRGDLLYESAMDSRESIADWVMEGAGALEFKDGAMEMSSAIVDGEPKGHIVFWCPKDFPDSFVAEWQAAVRSNRGLSIVFFAARGENGEDIFDPALPKRDGTFNQYTSGAIVSYHISYYANTRVTSNLRKNNRFYLVANGPPGIPPGDAAWHDLRLIKDGPHIQMQVDGRVIIDYADDGKRYGPVLGAGKIGFRQMQWTVQRYRNFRVWGLRP